MQSLFSHVFTSAHGHADVKAENTPAPFLAPKPSHAALRQVQTNTMMQQNAGR
jgi:hypothetical protein